MNEDIARQGVSFKCDGDRACTIPPKRAPSIIVPNLFRGIGQVGPQYRAIRMFTLVHYCDQHITVLDQAKLLDGLMTPSIKAGFEKAAKLKRASDFTCDFEQARLEWELVTTPDYRRFLAAMGKDGIMGAAKLTPKQQRELRWRQGLGVVAG